MSNYDNPSRSGYNHLFESQFELKSLLPLSFELGFIYIMEENKIIKQLSRLDLEVYASEILWFELDRLNDERLSIPIIRTHSRTACERKRDSRERQEKLDKINLLESKLKSDYRTYISDLKKCNSLNGFHKFEIK